MDNSKYLRMIKNSIKISQIPSLNKRVLVQAQARSLFISGTFGLTLYYIYMKYTSELMGHHCFKVTKHFNFEADPSSGKVSCTYSNAPNKLTGY